MVVVVFVQVREQLQEPEDVALVEAQQTPAAAGVVLLVRWFLEGHCPSPPSPLGAI